MERYLLNMDYLINFGSFAGIFAVPCEVVDNYINEASPDELKVLLYILRCQSNTINDVKMSDFLGLTHEKIKKSINYWADKAILTINNTLCDDKAKKVEVKPSKKIVQAPISYSSDEIESISQQNPELQFLISAVPNQLGRLITTNDCATLAYLYTGVGLPADVILMIIEYCVSQKKGNMNYIQKMALGWADEEINTHEKAEEKIKRLEYYNSYEGKVKSVLGVTGRAFSDKEKGFIHHWADDLCSSIEFISLAYEKCVDNTGKFKIEYMNTILENWHKKGIKSVEAAKNDKNEKATHKSSKSTSYDIDEYERLSIIKLGNGHE
jgi:DnaD/phage-associated family protein